MWKYARKKSKGESACTPICMHVHVYLLSWPKGLTGPLGKYLIRTLPYEEWIHTEVEVCASVSVCWGLIFALDVLIWSVLQRHTETCWDHTSALQNNRLYQEPLLRGCQQLWKPSVECIQTQAQMTNRHVNTFKMTRFQ